MLAGNLAGFTDYRPSKIQTLIGRMTMVGSIILPLSATHSHPTLILKLALKNKIKYEIWGNYPLLLSFTGFLGGNACGIPGKLGHHPYVHVLCLLFCDINYPICLPRVLGPLVPTLLAKAAETPQQNQHANPVVPRSVTQYHLQLHLQEAATTSMELNVVHTAE